METRPPGHAHFLPFSSANSMTCDVVSCHPHVDKNNMNSVHRPPCCFLPFFSPVFWPVRYIERHAEIYSVKSSYACTILLEKKGVLDVFDMSKCILIFSSFCPSQDAVPRAAARPPVPPEDAVGREHLQRPAGPLHGRRRRRRPAGRGLRGPALHLLHRAALAHRPQHGQPPGLPQVPG